MQLEGIDHVALGVRDIERSAKWYIEVLGFERLHEGMWKGVPTFIGKGNTGIALFPASPDAQSTPSTHREHPNASPRFSRKPTKFSRRAARTGKARNQIRIPRPRDFALHLFPRSRRSPAGDHNLRIAQAALTCHVERSRLPSRSFMRRLETSLDISKQLQIPRLRSE